MKKFVGKTRRSIRFDYDHPKILLFGNDTLRQMKQINSDPDNLDMMVEKGLDTDKVLATDVFAFKYERTITKGRTTYDVNVGKFQGQRDDSDNAEYAKIYEELMEYIKPSDLNDVEEFINNAGGGDFNFGSEAESETEEVEDETDSVSDDLEIDEPSEEVEESSGEVEEESEEDNENEEEEEEETGDISMDDLDSLLDS